jgi:hypothetical protein
MLSTKFRISTLAAVLAVTAGLAAPATATAAGGDVTTLTTSVLLPAAALPPGGDWTTYGPDEGAVLLGDRITYLDAGPYVPVDTAPVLQRARRIADAMFPDGTRPAVFQHASRYQDTAAAQQAEAAVRAAFTSASTVYPFPPKKDADASVRLTTSAVDGVPLYSWVLAFGLNGEYDRFSLREFVIRRYNVVYVFRSVASTPVGYEGAPAASFTSSLRAAKARLETVLP